MSPRRRAATEEEASLFLEAMKDAAPLKARARPPRLAATHDMKALRALPVSMPVYVDRPAPRIGGHDDARLRRGQSEPEDRLDLHGMTQEAAYRSCVRFLKRAQAEGKRLLLVITGKGGVLRAQLPLWLGQSDFKTLVSGMSEAHIRHGGSGAFYITLKRKRP